MDTRIRRAIFLTFFLAFIVVAPILVLHASGYRLDLRSRRIYQTGVITINSRPSAADVWLNDDASGRRTPVKLADVLPGEYAVSLHKDGYRPWSARVTVRSGQAVNIGDVPLLREAAPTLAAEQPFSQYTVAADQSEILGLADGTEQTTLYRFNHETDRFEAVSVVLPAHARFDSPVRFGAVVISAPVGETRQYWAVRFSTDPLVRSLETPPVAWGSADWISKEQLLVERNGELCTFTPFGSVGPACQAFSAAAFWYARDTLYYFIQDEPTTYLYAASVRNPATGAIIARLPSSVDYELTADNPSHLVVRDVKTGALLIVSGSGDQMQTTSYSGVTLHPVWNAQQDRLLIAGEFEIWIWDVQTGERELATRVSEPITDAHWGLEDSHILYNQAGRLIALDIWSGNRTATEIAGQSDGWFTYDSLAGGIVFEMRNSQRTSVWFQPL